jgi:endonuclease YncB( thermonuclease family)
MKKDSTGSLGRIVVALVFCLVSSNLHAASLSGRVVGITDGDTVKVLSEDRTLTRIRLERIDAPEKNQPFGQAAKQSLSELIFQQTVRIEVSGQDSYGRSLGQIWFHDRDINLEQIKRGMAWVYRHYSKDPGYLAAEQIARSKKLGLWRDEHPLPPWDFRRSVRENIR